MLDRLARQIREVVKELPKCDDYDFSHFTRAGEVASMSTALNTLVSKLVSTDNISKESLSLSQCIQSVIANVKKMK